MKLIINSSLLLLSFLLLTASTCGVQPPMSGNDGCIDTAKIDLEGMCTMEYNPVCGCDGKTYGNPCAADKAGVLFTTKGECGKCIDGKKIDGKKPCTKEYMPVCGCNHVTYGNECLAGKAGVTTWTKGACKNGDSSSEIGKDCYDPKQVRMTPCTKEYMPVCGCNGKTYPNDCMARNSGVLKWEKGKCGDANGGTSGVGKDCVDPKQIKMTDCPEIYKPVCGCDGKTYSNKCEASNDGVLKWKDGACN